MAGLDSLAGEPMLVHRLVIDGLAVRFNSLPEGVTDSTDAVPGTGAAVDYVDLADMLPPDGWSDRLGAVGGVVEAGATSIRILTDELDGATDAGHYLTALPNGSTRAAVMTETVDATATTIKLDRDVSGLTIPAIWHIGHEAVYVTAAAGVQADPDVANPYRVTVTRGVAGTVAVEHVVDVDRGVAPSVYSSVVNWRRRRARLEIAYVEGIGSRRSLTDWIELRRGFLETAPTPDPDGMAFELTLVPLSAIIDLDMTAATTITTLVDGAHQFDGFAASTIEWAVYLPGFNIDLGETTAVSAADGGLLRIDVAAHDEIFDVSLPTLHPRSGAVKAPLVDPMFVESYNDVGGANEGLTVLAGPTAAVASGTTIKGIADTELHRFSIAAGVYSWPLEIVEDWRDAATSSREGAGGAFLDLYPVADPGALDGWAAMTENNCLDAGLVDDAAPRAVLWDPHPRRPGQFRQPGTAITWSTDVQNHGPAPRAYFTSAGRELPRVATDRLLYYPLFSRRDDGDFSYRGTSWHSLHPRRRRTVAHGGVFELPTGFYQSGEPSILVADDLPTPSTIAIEWSEPWGLEPNGTPTRRIHRARITASASVVLPDGSTGYALTLEDPDSVPSFGNWSGVDPVAIRVDVQEQGAAEVLVDLFTEVARLDEDDDIDAASFRRVPDPIGLGFTSPVLNEPTDLREIVEPILQVTGTALVMRTDEQGRNRITRVPVGPENPIESIASLTDADCLDSPEYGTDDATIGRVIVRANYQPDGEAGSVQTFINEAVINEAGFDAGTLELNLYSVQADDLGDLFAPAELVFATVGYPRRVWSLVVPLSIGWPLFAGAVVQITSSDVRGHGAVGVTGLYARIVSTRFDLDAGEVQFVAQYTGTNGTGWNAALEITAVDNATTVTIDTASYIPAEHPVTGAAIDAFELWAVGYECFVFDTGDHDNATATKVASVGAGKVEFEDAHGIAGAPFGAVEPSGYDSAPSVHQQLAYLADADGLLGSGDDSGQQAT